MLTYYAYDSITVNGKEVPKATDMTLEKAWTVLTFKKEVSSERTLKALKIEENGKKVPIFIAKERVGKMLLKSQFNTCFEDAETVTIGFNVAADTKLHFTYRQSASLNTALAKSEAKEGLRDEAASDHKYPSVFFMTPVLLETASEATLNGKVIPVTGVVGHIKEGDKIKYVEVKQVDDEGNTVGEAIIIPATALHTNTKPLESGRTVLYAGKHYTFATKMLLSRFNTAIRAEVVTEGVKEQALSDGCSLTKRAQVLARRLLSVS